MKPYLWPALISVLSLFVYTAFTLLVGAARGKYGVPAPQITGHPDFERAFRVQQNTLEQIILFLPALWLFSFFISPIYGAGLGALWIVGRVVYAVGYYKEAKKRAAGFGITFLATLGLMGGALVGVILAFFR